MKLGDMFYTRVKHGKVVCYQLFRIVTEEEVKQITSEPKVDTRYSFRRVNPVTKKSLGNCDYSLNLKEATKKYKPLTEAIKILFTKEQV